MHTQGYFLFAIAVPNIILGTFILFRNIKDPINVFFSAFAFAVSLWAFGLGGFIFSNNLSHAQFWAQMYYIAAALIAPIFFLFATAFTGMWPKLRFGHVIALIPGIIVALSIALASSLLIDDVVPRNWGKEVVLNKSGYILYTIYFSVYVSTGFAILLRQLLKSKGISRTYLKYVTIGLVIAFSMGATFNLFLPFFGNYRYIWAGPLFTLFYLALVSYAIVRHKLFDMRIIVVRSIAYALSIFSIGILFGAIVFGLVDSVVRTNNLSVTTQRTLLTSVAIVLAFSFQPLKKFFDKLTRNLFYQDSYDAEVLLDELNKVLVSNIDINKLVNLSSEVMNFHIKTEYSAFGLTRTEYRKQRIIVSGDNNFRDEDVEYIKKLTAEFDSKVIVSDLLDTDQRELQRRLRRNNIAVFVSLSSDVKGDGVGFIALGPKKSGSNYNSQDVKVLEIIANSLVIAIDNALRFEEIQNFNVTLQRNVENATRKLRNNNEKLKALDETKDEFISMASHQLRTPLTSVKGYLSMVIEGDAGKLNDQQEKLLKQAFFSSQRMVYLISDLLNVSRLRTGKFIVETSPTDLPALIQGEIDQLRETAEARGVKLVFNRPKDFPTLDLDETKIRQVIMNFLDNAIYYSPKGGDINIKLEELAKTIEFKVIDSGIGVPKTQQHQLFGKFYRAENAKRARPDGTGLGLFMAKKVVIAQGGAIIFSSAENKGSTFGFIFSKSKVIKSKK